MDADLVPGWLFQVERDLPSIDDIDILIEQIQTVKHDFEAWLADRGEGG